MELPCDSLTHKGFGEGSGPAAEGSEKQNTHSIRPRPWKSRKSGGADQDCPIDFAFALRFEATS